VCGESVKRLVLGLSKCLRVKPRSEMYSNSPRNLLLVALKVEVKMCLLSHFLVLEEHICDFRVMAALGPHDRGCGSCPKPPPKITDTQKTLWRERIVNAAVLEWASLGGNSGYAAGRRRAGQQVKLLCPLRNNCGLPH
jgi:hypothetical protein